MGRTLIVYFSRTGYTRGVAEEMAAAFGADLEAVRDARKRSGVLGYLRSAREALRRSLIEIQPTENDPSQYDLVVLGTPVWAGHVSSPMRAYVSANRNGLKRVALFCTMGGSGGTAALTEMAGLCGREPVATLTLTDNEIDKGLHSSKLSAFVSESGVHAESAA
jgi:flavodoxin